EIGVLKGVNSGSDWTYNKDHFLDDMTVTSVVPTPQLLTAGDLATQVVVASATDFQGAGGVFLSLDGGANFTPLSGLPGSNLPAGSVSELVQGPTDNTVIAAVSAFFDTNNDGREDAKDTAPPGNKGIYLGTFDAAAHTYNWRALNFAAFT